MNRAKAFRLVFLFLLVSLAGYFIYDQVNRYTNPKRQIKLYFSQLETLIKEEKWEEIVQGAEDILGNEKKRKSLAKAEEFRLLDQLISTHFRLGNFEKAKEYAESLLVQVNDFNCPELIINSLYKFSSVLRAEAEISLQQKAQERLFREARHFCEKALAYCQEHCPENKSLKARVLFNLGAAEADDPKGNLREGISLYQEALSLFSELNEEDYRQRTLIRLGKAYFVKGELEQSWQMIEELNSLEPKERTRMHLYLLEARILSAKKLYGDAEKLAKQGKEIAEHLHAKRDCIRFDELIYQIQEEEVKIMPSMTEISNEKEPLLPFSEQAKSIIQGQIYEHYSGKRYKLLFVGRDSETLEEKVVYQALYGENDIWIRPLAMFIEEVEIEDQLTPRFRLLSSNDHP